MIRSLHPGIRCVALGMASAWASAWVGGCATGRPAASPSAHGAYFDPHLYVPVDRIREEVLDLRVSDRAVVEGSLGENLLRVRFSFVAYEGYIGAGDTHRSTGTIFLPVGGGAEAHPARPGEAVLTEFPPGSSVSGFPIHPEYGERPAVELGIPAAVVDVRGPIVRDLRNYANPSAGDDVPFADEEQFAYSMLRSFQETGDPTLLYEQRVATAWLRAMRAVDGVIRQETGVGRNRFVLVAQGYGALAAAQAASVEPRVSGLVLCGWPLDWADLHFTRWRRWERQARYDPLARIQPIPYRDSQEVLSFLFSSYGSPDPGCPSCEGGGDRWRAQFNLLDLWRDRRLRRVQTLVLMGDSDPELPIDLEARASAPAEEIALHPSQLPRRARPGGPFAEPGRLPFHDLRYLHGASSTLANPEAAESVMAWIQHVVGYRDVPKMRLLESIENGEFRVEAVVLEGNTAVTGVEIYLTEIQGRDDSDFKHRSHRRKPEPVSWRRIDTIYAGHGEARRSVRFAGRWKGYFPVSFGKNRAYYVVVRDRVGDLESAHSLPIRPLWNLGDPAVGPARP